MSLVRWMKRSLWVLPALALPLMVSDALAQAPGDSIPPNAEWVLFPSQPCVEDDVVLHVRGYYATPCDSFISAYRAEDRVVVVRRLAHVDRLCLVPPLWFFSVPMHFGPLPSGLQSITIRYHSLALHEDGRLDSVITETKVHFDVSGTCALPPLVPVNELPYVHAVTTDPSPACPSLPTSLVVAGHFQDGCGQVTDVDTARNRITLAPYPPRRTPCPTVLKPWRAELPQGMLAAGNHSIVIGLDVLGTTTSWPPIPTQRFRSEFQFRVAAQCDSAPPDTLFPCLRGDWARRGRVACDAFLSPSITDSAELTFEIATGVALAGLQGRLRFQELGLQVTKLEAIGPASGMRLSWTRAEDFGARFVLFSDHGAPIPISRDGVPVLRVTVGIAPIRVAWPDPPVFHLTATELLGSDIDGHGVEDCSTRILALTVPPTATICIERACDFNVDGTADVRDLVLMIHCFNGSGPCPPGQTRFDCDGDGRFGLPDVLCCAAHVLRGPDCPDCPVDSVRAEPAVRASFGAPIRTQSGVDVPLRLEGADRVGAARLALQFPSDRFRVAAIDLQGRSGRWLALHETEPDRLSVGLIGMQAAEIAGGSSDPLEIMIHLELEPGATVGGQISLEGGELSGPDGVMLGAQLGTPGRSLDAPVPVSVSPVRPNPSRGAVQFSVTLERAARLALGVYDISGRLVADLFHGERGAGTHDFRWDGAAANGTAAREGVYFLRASVANGTVVKRVVLLSRD